MTLIGIRKEEEEWVDDVSFSSQKGTIIARETMSYNDYAIKPDSEIPSSSSSKSAAAVRSKATTTNDEKRLKRILSNRKSAKSSQERRKVYINELHSAYDNLSSQNNALRKQNMKLRQMKQMLQRQLIASKSLNNLDVVYTQAINNDEASSILPSPHNSLPLTINSSILPSVLPNNTQSTPNSTSTLNSNIPSTTAIPRSLNNDFLLLNDDLTEL